MSSKYLQTLVIEIQASLHKHMLNNYLELLLDKLKLYLTVQNFWNLGQYSIDDFICMYSTSSSILQKIMNKRLRIRLNKKKNR